MSEAFIFGRPPDHRVVKFQGFGFLSWGPSGWSSVLGGGGISRAVATSISIYLPISVSVFVSLPLSKSVAIAIVIAISICLAIR